MSDNQASWPLCLALPIMSSISLIKQVWIFAQNKCTTMSKLFGRPFLVFFILFFFLSPPLLGKEQWREWNIFCLFIAIFTAYFCYRITTIVRFALPSYQRLGIGEETEEIVGLIVPKWGTLPFHYHPQPPITARHWGWSMPEIVTFLGWFFFVPLE